MNQWQFYQQLDAYDRCNLDFQQCHKNRIASLHCNGHSFRAPKRERPKAPKRERWKAPKRECPKVPKREHSKAPKRECPKAPKRERSVLFPIVMWTLSLFDPTCGFEGEGPQKWTMASLNVGSLEKHSSIFERQIDVIAIQETRHTAANRKHLMFEAANHDLALHLGPNMTFSKSGIPSWGGCGNHFQTRNCKTVFP